MWARVATFEGGDTERLRQLNEGSQGPEVPDGMRKAILLASADGGKRMFITFFDDKDAIAAAEQRFEAMGDEIPEEVRGKRTSVDVYEVLMDGMP